MKKYFSVQLIIAFSFILFSTALLSQNFDSSKVKDVDVEKLRMMGVSEDKIKQFEDYKNKSNAKSDNNAVNEANQKNQESNPNDLIKKKSQNAIGINHNNDTLLNKETHTFPMAKIYGQEIFRTNNLDYFRKSKDAQAGDSYLLGAGDEIAVSVWGFSEYNDVFKISEDGYISPKNVGRIYLKGFTYGKAKTLLIQKFSKIVDLASSQIDFSLNYSRVINVNIVGEVFYPGSYSIPAANTAFNALVAIGGPTDIGSVRNIYIKRNGKIIDSLDVYKFLMNPKNSPDIYLENNDYLIVSVASKTVSIGGAITRTNVYELKKEEKLLTALSYAGGLSSSAFKGIVQIRRYEENKEVTMDVDIDSLINNKKDFVLVNGDRINVRKIPEGIENSVFIKGSVRLEGYFELLNGERVSDVIKKAEGLKYDAYMERAFVIRQNDTNFGRIYIPFSLTNALQNVKSDDDIILQRNDTLKILSKKDFVDNFKITVNGWVRKPGDFNFGENLTLNDAIYFAGGIRPEAALNRIEISRIVDINKLDNTLTPVRTIVKTIAIKSDLSIDQDSSSFILQPYDYINVRKNADFEVPMNIALNGEVVYPGTYQLLSKDETVSELINRAGGLTNQAFPEGVKMIRNDNKIGVVYLNLPKALKQPKSRFDLVLTQGDVITIPTTMDLVYITGGAANNNLENFSVPYFRNRRALFYINNFAGGFRLKADRSKTILVTPTGITKRTVNFGLFKLYPKVTKGSRIYTYMREEKDKEKKGEPIDWNKVIERTTVKITAILTLMLLLKTVFP